MTQTHSDHLIDILAKVPDPRNTKGKRYPLCAILALAVIARMCGYRSYSAIAQWGRTYASALVEALGFTHASSHVLRRYTTSLMFVSLGCKSQCFNVGLHIFGFSHLS